MTETPVLDPVLPTPTPSPWRRRLIRAALVLAAVALLWTLLIGWALPHFLKPRIEAAGSAALGAPLSIEALEVAPWTLGVDLRGLRLGPVAAPWFTLGRAEAQVALESVWRLAPVVRRLTLTAPKLDLERQAPGRFNISPMLEALAKQPPSAPDAEPARFAIHNIRVEDGQVHLVDRVGASEQRIEGLRMGVPFLSNLPSDLRVDVEPLLEARVNGSPLRLAGRTQPFSAGQRSAIDLRWNQVDVGHWLAAAAPLLPADLPVRLERGQLDLDLQVAFERRPAPAVASLHLTGGATLAQWQAQAPAQGARTQWERLTLTGLDLRPLERQAHIASVTLSGPEVELDLPTLLGRPGAGGARPAQAAAPGSQSAVSASVPAALPSSAPASAPASAQASAPGAASAPRAASAPASPAATSPAASGWQWRIDTLAVNGGRVRLQDPAWPTGTALNGIEFTASDLGSGASRPAAFQLTLQDGDGARLQSEGRLEIDAGKLTATLDLAQLRAAAWAAPWRAALPVQLQDGRLSLQGQLSADRDGWAVREGQVRIDGLQVAPSPGPAPPAAAEPGRIGPATRPGPAVARSKTAATPAGSAAAASAATSAAVTTTVARDSLTIARLEASGIELRAAAREALSVQAGAVRADRLDLKAQRGREGRLAWAPGPGATPAAPPSAAAAAATAAKTGSTAASAPAPSWRIAELRCQQCAATLSDLSVSPAASVTLSRTELRLRALSGDPRAPVDFTLDAGVGKDGRAQLAGSVRPEPLALRSRVALERVDLGALRPYLDPYLNLTLAAARTSAAGDLSVDGTAREAVSSARWKGRLALADLRALDRLNDADFLRFKGLSLEGADLQWRPGGVEADLGQVRLSGFYSRVIVNSDGRINLRDIVRSSAQDGARSLTTATTPADAAGPAAASAPAAPASAAPKASPAAPTPVRWRGIQLEAGQVDFTDNFIRPNYSARLTGIGGSVSALAWNDPQPAEVKITGKVDDSAPLDISGTVHPLGARLQTDLTASARGIDITRLSAYSARYAGYGIDKGTLSAKVHYRIDNGKLSAENQLYLDQLSFGDKVESPDALKLPILLAVSLLKDRNGVIDINLPISGSLDDPQFSVGALVGRVIVNLISKAITAPFALLGQVFGGGQQQLSHVGFEPGSAVLGDAALATLDTLTKALIDRPALKLDITGRADPASDGPALRRAHVDQLMRAAKAKATGIPLADTRIEATERPRWLEAAYQAADLKTRPRNAVGLLKTLPEADMEALLAASAAVGPEQLRTLADRRADHVKARLAEQVPSERLLVTASRLDATGIDDQSAPTQASFALQ